MLNSAKFLKGHESSNGKLGATGLCYGGGVVNNLAVRLGADLDAGVPFYVRALATKDVAKIQAPLMMQYTQDDHRVDASSERCNFLIYTLPLFSLTIIINNAAIIIIKLSKAKSGFPRS